MQSTTILSLDASEYFACHVYITVVHLMVSLNGCYEFIDFEIICDEADRACRDDEQSFAKDSLAYTIYISLVNTSYFLVGLAQHHPIIR